MERISGTVLKNRRLDLVQPCLDRLFRQLRFRWLNWNNRKGDQGKATSYTIVYSLRCLENQKSPQILDYVLGSLSINAFYMVFYWIFKDINSILYLFWIVPLPGIEMKFSGRNFYTGKIFVWNRRFYFLLCRLRPFLSKIPTYNSLSHPHINSQFLLSRSGNSFLKTSRFSKKKFHLSLRRKWEL